MKVTDKRIKIKGPNTSSEAFIWNNPFQIPLMLLLVFNKW